MKSHTPEAWQGSLFDEPAETRPQGLRYGNGFLSVDEEATLLSAITALPLREMRYKSYTARRRVVSYGASYDFDEGILRPSGPPPAFLKALGAKVANWAGLRAESITQILVAEYQPGTPLGWHRDVPDFEDIVGVSLASAALRYSITLRTPASRKPVR